MDLRSILTHPEFYIYDEDGRPHGSRFFRLPLSYNDPCWVNSEKEGLIWTKGWRGETKRLDFTVSNLRANDWFFCDEDGNFIEVPTNTVGMNERE